MSGTAQLAAEELKRFAASLRNVMALADQLASMEDPAVLAQNNERLKREASALISSYREQAEAQARRNMQSAVDAAGIKAKSILEDAEGQRAAIIAAAQSQANEILANARKAGEELTKKYAAAHQAAQAAMK
jgi:cell division septum initiation protein DivIVA